VLQGTSIHPPILPNYLDLEHPEQVNVLLEPLVQRILAALLQQPSSVAELSRRLGLVLGVVHHRLSRLERLGLVHVIARHKRRGRAIKVYGPSAREGWRFPFSLSSVLSFEDLVMLYMNQYGREFCRSIAAQFEGEVWIQYGRNNSKKVGFDVEVDGRMLESLLHEHTLGSWGHLDLTPEQAQSFVRELEDLYARYANPASSSGTKPHLLGLFLTQTLE
jgi:DNA-binding transcriptional ArsR family regulator